MKIVVNYKELMSTMTFVKEMDPVSFENNFGDDTTFDSIEGFIESMKGYNEEAEGIIRFDIKLNGCMDTDEKGNLLRDVFCDDDEFILTVDSDVYSRYCNFMAKKMRPIVKLIMSIVEFFASFSEDVAEFFENLLTERKLARLEREERERKQNTEKAENEASEKEAQEQLDEHDDAISMEEFIAKCEAKVDEVSKKN